MNKTQKKVAVVTGAASGIDMAWRKCWPKAAIT